jgi:ATP-dependent helicase HrpB
VLPVEDVLPAVLSALDAGSNAVLIAPPGAGKTTLAPLRLREARWATGRILLLAPRRLAARGAAARMAALLGERPGETVGYRVRLESRVSARTRIEVVTEGVFTRQILDDPSLEGVSAVLFDEFHERSLEADLALALALDAQAGLRPDLRLLVMSATLEGERVAGLLGGAPVLRSQGRQFPIEDRYLGRRPDLRIELQAADAARRALGEQAGSVLVFLPGASEIARTARRLEETLRDPAVSVHPLHGGLELAAQDAAIASAGSGRRKIVLATAIAETSLTIEGVGAVVDCGLARRARHEPAIGVTRLETGRVSQAAAAQRRGRAGRTGPGVCYRLWDEQETAALAPFDPPEMLAADLAPLALTLAAWGVRDPGQLSFLDPPPKGAWAEAIEQLSRLGALDSAGALSAHGRAMERFGLPPRLAHMLLAAGARGQAGLAARIAAVLSERGLGGTSTDVFQRLGAFGADRGARAQAMRGLARRWAEAAGGALADGDDAEAAEVLALAFPDRVAKARGAAGEFLLANGRGARLDPADPLAAAPFLVVGDLQGAAGQARITLAARLDAAGLQAAFGDAIMRADVAAYDKTSRSVIARRQARLGAILLQDAPLPAPPAQVVREAVLDAVRREGIGLLPWPEAARAFQARVAFARTLRPDAFADLSDAGLQARLADWLTPALEGVRSLDAVSPEALVRALEGLIDWPTRQTLDRLAPATFETPAGSRLSIDYAGEAGPVLSVRVQELFGLDRHPSVGEGQTPLSLHLLSPAHRPVQVTRDLPGFWRGSYAAVRVEMKARYPKHPWPENPLAAPPTTRAKPRGS